MEVKDIKNRKNNLDGIAGYRLLEQKGRIHRGMEKKDADCRMQGKEDKDTKIFRNEGKDSNCKDGRVGYILEEQRRTQIARIKMQIKTIEKDKDCEDGREGYRLGG